MSHAGKRFAEKIAFQFTFLFRREGSQWSSLACEVDIASCGRTQKEAREGLREAVSLYISYMIENGLRGSIARPVPEDALRQFVSAPGGAVKSERHTMIAEIWYVLATEQPEVEAEFVPTELGLAPCTLTPLQV